MTTPQDQPHQRIPYSKDSQILNMNRLLWLSLLPCLISPYALGATNPSTNVGGNGKAVTTILTMPTPMLLTQELADTVKSGYLLQGDAASLVDATVCLKQKCSTDRGTYVLINLVNWGNTPISSNWYIFRGGSSKLFPWRPDDFDGGQRLFGAKRTLLLSIQVSPDHPAGIPKYTVAESKRVPTNFQHLSDLLGVILPSAKATGGAKIKGGGSYYSAVAIPRKYPTADITIKTTIPTPVNPPAAPAIDDPGSSPPQDTPDVKKQPVGVGGPRDISDEGAVRERQQQGPIPQPQPPAKPADVVSSSAPAAPDTSGDVSMPDYSITDESKSFWDLSIAVPITKVSELQFSSVNNTVTPSQVNKQSVFAVLDLYVPPKDLVGLKYSFIPHPLVGVSMASQPLHSLLFAGAIGLSFGEVYVGANLLKQQNVSGLVAGSTATPEQLSAASSQGFQAHFMIGINISIKSAFSAAANGTK